MRPELKRGARIAVRGQVETMQSSFIGLGDGSGAGDRAGIPAHRRQFSGVARSLIIISARRHSAGRHCTWMLFLTGTRLSVQR
jgi:hypothetical protein